MRNLAFIFCFFGSLFGIIWSTNSFAQADFSDVPAESEFSGMYQHLIDVGITTKRANNTYQPLVSVNRIEGLVMAMRSAGVFPANQEEYSFSFNDITDSWAFPYIHEAIRRGFIQDGDNFYPAEAITKAQYLDWLTRFGGVNLKKFKPEMYNIAKDVPADSPYAMPFAYAKTYHIIHLHPDGHFYPFNTLNRHEASVITYRHLRAIKSRGIEKSKLKIEGAFQNFLSAIRGQRYGDAESFALIIRQQTRAVTLKQNDNLAITADALSRSVDHFVDALRSFKYEKSAKGYSDLLLAIKQCDRALEDQNALSEFAFELKDILKVTLEELSQTSM